MVCRAILTYELADLHWVVEVVEKRKGKTDGEKDEEVEADL